MRIERSSGVSIAVALAAGSIAMGLLIWVSGRSPAETLAGLVTASFGSTLGLGQMASRLVPLLLCAVAAGLPAQAMLINIGGEGQIVMGGIAAALFLEFAPGGNATVLLTGACVAALAGGAAAALIPAIGRAMWGVNEALSSLFLNYVCTFVLAWLVHGPMRDPASMGWPVARMIPASSQWQHYGPYRIYAGLPAAILVVCVVAAFLRLTRQGFELQAVGKGVAAARLAGIPVRAFVMCSFLAGGMAAGLAGFFELTAVQLRLRPELSLGFGYYGFLIAWICRGQWGLVLATSILVSALVVGADALQIISKLPAATADIFLGLTMLLVLISRQIDAMASRRRALAATAERDAE